MQKAVQARDLDVGLAAGYLYSRKGRAIQDNPKYCANSKELMDNAITKFENASYPYLDVVSRCSKESLDVLKALELVTVRVAGQKELAGGQCSNTSVATVITPLDSHVATV
jgi:hypothetical protein